MTTSQEYIIQIAGLCNKEYVFDYNIGESFFEELEYPEIKKSNIRVRLNLLNQTNMMVLRFSISGTINEHCDRCADEFDLEIKGESKLVVNIGHREEGGDERDDDIITIASNERMLDISQYIYEYIILSMPSKRAHTNIEDCNKTVIDKLNGLSIEEENLLDEEEETTDPRWKELMNIKLN
jgi:uncharacterized metal-binding protein YceD (DUF177 family)